MTTLTETTTVQTSSGPVTVRHRPEISVSVNNEATWITCTLCGRSDYARRFSGKSHKSYCDLRGSFGFSAGDLGAKVASAASPMTAEEARSAGEAASRDGMVHSRFRTSDDLVGAVANGFISESNAMNSDD